MFGDIGRGAGLFSKRVQGDSAREFSESRAYKEAAKAPGRYPTLLSGVEWWLPLTTGPSVFSAPRVTGQPTLMGRIDQLVTELQTLARQLGLTRDEDRERIRQAGPPSSPDDLHTTGQFGLAVFHSLALTAQRSRQPLVLDY